MNFILPKRVNGYYNLHKIHTEVKRIVTLKGLCKVIACGISTTCKSISLRGTGCSKSKIRYKYKEKETEKEKEKRYVFTRSSATE